MKKLQKVAYIFLEPIYRVLQALWFLLIILPIFLVVVVPFSTIRYWLVRPKRPRILWAPIPIINIHYNSRADRLMGYESDTMVFDIYHIVHGKLFTYNLASFAKFPFGFFLPSLAFLWSTLKYDIFCFFYIGGFFYANTLIKYMELPLLKLAGKKIILFAYGADVRQEDITRHLGKYHCYSAYPLGYSERPDQLVKRDIAHMMKWANLSVSMGDMLEYTPGSRNDVFYWPIDIKDWQPHYPSPTKTKNITIVHAPNNKLVKGSDYLIETVQRLQEEGYSINLDLVQGLPNHIARQHYEAADIFAEQFLIGFHGFTAIEVMALGKPLICYIRKPADYLLNSEECPIVSANPDELYKTLKRLIDDGQRRHELGKSGRAYVENYFSLEAGGERLAALYREVWPHG